MVKEQQEAVVEPVGQIMVETVEMTVALLEEVVVLELVTMEVVVLQLILELVTPVVEEEEVPDGSLEQAQL